MSCSTGPGKYEGEGPETFLLDILLGQGAEDDMVSNPEWGDGAAIFRGPRRGTIVGAYPQAMAHGYAGPCIAEAISRLETMSGAVLSWGSTGFVTSRLFDDPGELAREWALYTEEYDDDEDEGGQS